jgi:sugar (pentulose or hexulose) kinase
MRRSTVAREQVAGVGIVAQREPVVLIGADGEALAPAISWTDQRTSSEAREVSDRFGRTWLIDRTGMAPLRGSSLTQLLWLRRHRPDVWRETRRIMFAKDYVLHRLTGIFATDVSTPGRSLMLDIEQGDYSEEICEAFGVELDHLPPIRDRSCDPAGGLEPDPANDLSLEPGTRVALGGADDAAATLGAGAIEPGQVCVGTGTGTDWRTVLDGPHADPTGSGDVAPHVVPGRFIFEVAIDSTGSSLRWLREALAPELSVEALIKGAERVGPGANGLCFFPYVDGAERAPRYLTGATGAFVGIVSGHTREHLTRALLEGIAYQYPPTMEIVSARARPRPPLVTGDGEARSAAWNQIKADVLGVSLVIPRIIELAAAGAAILAGVAGDVFADVAAGARALVHPGVRFDPDPDRHRTYGELRASYERLSQQIFPSSDHKEHNNDH